MVIIISSIVGLERVKLLLLLLAVLKKSSLY